MRTSGRYLRMECGGQLCFSNGRAHGIDDFPDDDSLWRVEWIGGVGYNTSVPSDPRITVCLTQLPPGETNPLSARARFPASTPSGRQESDLVWRPVQGCAQVYVCPAPWQ